MVYVPVLEDTKYRGAELVPDSPVLPVIVVVLPDVKIILLPAVWEIVFLMLEKVLLPAIVKLPAPP